jgi:hypothetical protein
VDSLELVLGKIELAVSTEENTDEADGDKNCWVLLLDEGAVLWVLFIFLVVDSSEEIFLDEEEELEADEDSRTLLELLL